MKRVSGTAATASATATLREEEAVAPVVVACGGLFGDELEALHRVAPFTIRPGTLYRYHTYQKRRILTNGTHEHHPRRSLVAGTRR